MLGNFARFVVCWFFFFKIIFFKNFFQEYDQMSDSLDPDQAWQSAGPAIMIWAQTECNGYQQT